MGFSFDPQQRVLHTPRLVLRPLNGGDAAGLLRVYRDPEVTRYYELDPPSSISEAETILQFFLQHHDRFALIDPANNDLIGTCGLFMVCVQQTHLDT